MTAAARSSRIMSYLIVGLALVCGSSVAFGQKTWTGKGGDAQWNNPQNWSPVGIPGVGEVVSIPKATDTVIISPYPQAPIIGSLDCKGTLRISGVGVEIGGGSVVEKGLFLTNGATVHVTGPALPGYGLTVGTSLNPEDTVLELTGGGWIRIDNALTVHGGASINGRIEGPGTMELLAASTFTSFPSTEFHDATIINRGSCTIDGSDAFSSPTPSTLRNFGSITLRLTNSFNFIEIENHGTLQADLSSTINARFVQYETGVTDVQQGVLQIHNGTNGDSIDGQITIGAGSTLSLNGDHQLEESLAITGAGELRLAAPAPGMTVLCPTIDVPKVVMGVGGAPVRFENGTLIQDLSMEPGAKLGGAGLVTILDAFSAHGSVQMVDSGIVAITSSAVALMQADSELVLADTRQFINQGTLDLGSDVAITASGSPELTNQGTVTCSSGTVSPWGLIRNTGEIIKQGTGAFRIQCAFDNPGDLTIENGTLLTTRSADHSGAIDIQAGATLHVQGGSPDIHDFGTGCSVTGDGTLIAGGFATIAGTLNVDTLDCPIQTLTLNTDATLNHLVLRGGTIQGSGNIVANESATLNAGYLYGPAALDAMGTLTIDVTGPFAIGQDRIVTNFGQGVWSAGAVQNSGSGTFVNAPGATMDITTSGDWRLVYENRGTTTKSAGGNINIHAPVENSGQWIISAGSVTAYQRFTQTSGLLQLDGTTFGANVFNETPLDFSGGTLAGTGTINGVMRLGAGAKLEPGGPGSTGTLAISLDLLHEDGADIVMELAGTADNDTVNIGRHASIDGLIRVATLGGYSPAVGDAFRLLSFQSRSGAFDEISLPPLTEPKHRWDVETDGASLAVSVVGASPKRQDGPIEVDPD